MRLLMGMAVLAVTCGTLQADPTQQQVQDRIDAAEVVNLGLWLTYTSQYETWADLASRIYELESIGEDVGDLLDKLDAIYSLEDYGYLNWCEDRLVEAENSLLTAQDFLDQTPPAIATANLYAGYAESAHGWASSGHDEGAGGVIHPGMTGAPSPAPAIAALLTQLEIDVTNAEANAGGGGF